MYCYYYNNNNFRLISIVIIFASQVLCEQNNTESSIKAQEDTYLVAYKDAKALNHGNIINNNNNVKVINNREYNVDNGVAGGPYPGPINNGFDNNYGSDYHYGPPRPVYGPPANGYGPPNYYPPPPEPVYGVPHAMLGLLDKFKLKLDLFTLAKILLKLILFKKLVSFIAVICLFLFIPWLKHEKNDHDDDDEKSNDFRSFSNGDDRLNRLTSFVWESFRRYDAENTSTDTDCGTVYCKTQKIIGNLNDSLSYGRLWNMYKEEL